MALPVTLWVFSVIFVILVTDDSYTPLPADACAQTREAHYWAKVAKWKFMNWTEPTNIFCLPYTMSVNILNQQL